MPRVFIPPFTVRPAQLSALAGAETTPWGIIAIRAPETWMRTAGAGTVIAIGDTGVDAKHPDLAANVLALPSCNFSGEGATDDTADLHGHGTHVAGTCGAVANELGVIGGAHKARILPLKCLNRYGSGDTSIIALAMQRVAALRREWNQTGGKSGQPIVVMNLSLGSAADDPAMRAAADELEAAGVFLAAAAGNDPAAGILYPAAYPTAAAVGAVDVRKARAWFSAGGPGLMLVGPGVSVLSTWPGGQHRMLDGTSMATPHVTAVVDLMQSHELQVSGRFLTPAEVRERLAKWAEDLGTPGRDDDFGIGFVTSRISELPPPAEPPAPPEPTPAFASLQIRLFQTEARIAFQAGGAETRWLSTIPFTIYDRMYMPASDVFGLLGWRCAVGSDGIWRAEYESEPGGLVRFSIDPRKDNKVLIAFWKLPSRNLEWSESWPLPHEAFMVADRAGNAQVFGPMRYLLEPAQYRIAWDGASKTATITKR